MTTFALDISSTIPRISHSVMHKQSWLLLLLGPSVGRYDSLSDVGEIRVYQRADFQSGSRVLKKVF